MRTLYELGELRLDPEARVLSRSGAPVTLGARAVAVLAALVGRANEYVPKADIMEAAWPGLVVEEGNLAVQISAIRRALAQVAGGEGWVETLARRGYRFVGPVAVIAGRAGETPTPFDRKRTNLPQVLTSFVGREREIAEIKRLLPETRLLTLTGTGGIGKTRLALQAAAEILNAYCDGIWFVDLAPLTDPLLVPSAVAQVLGVKEATGEALTQTLCGYLRAKEMLLVLDNCEHLLGASADLVDVLVRNTAGITVIATSREPLHVASERVYPLNALSLPDPKAEAKAIARSDAVKLFLDRARQHRPRFDLEGPRARAAATICVRLDGLPLALELAAARIAVLPVEEIERLLDQRFRLLTRGDGDLPRQQTLRAMIDWSYELLDQAEQQLFTRLSVFAGGWTLAAARAICGTDPLADDDVVYRLIALIEKSLVIADEDGDRYRMLETVREYAREKLPGVQGAHPMQERHRDYFLALAEEAYPKLMGGDQLEWRYRLESELENLRAAFSASISAADPAAALRFCAALQEFWWMRGYLTEGREWCSRALDKAGAEEPTAEYAKTLNAAGTLAYMQSDYAAARAHYGESLVRMRSLGDTKGVAVALNNLGLVALDHGDVNTARPLMEQSLAINRELGDKNRVAFVLGNLGLIAFEQRDLDQAQRLHEESLAILREVGDANGIGIVLGNLGNVASGRGDYVAARTLQEESLAIRRKQGDRWGTAACLCNLGNVANMQGQHATARPLFEETLSISRELGEEQGVAFALIGLAAATAASGLVPRAARLWGAAARLQEEIGTPLNADDRPHHDRYVAAARAALGDDAAFDRAWAQGRAMPLEQAIELALEDTTE